MIESRPDSAYPGICILDTFIMVKSRSFKYIRYGNPSVYSMNVTSNKFKGASRHISASLSVAPNRIDAELFLIWVLDITVRLESYILLSPRASVPSVLLV